MYLYEKEGLMKVKNLSLKKCMSAAIGCIMMVSVLFYSINSISTIHAANANLVKNSTFDSGTSGWATYQAGGGNASISTENGKLALKVKSVGSLNYGAQVFYDIVPLYENGVYHLKYEISSSVNRKVEGILQQNGGTYQAYTWKELSLTPQPQTIDYEFTMTAETDIMAKLVFNCGNQGSDLPEHTIYLDNVTLELVDDSKVTYPSSGDDEEAILINQIGYKPESQKIAIFRNISNEREFSVVNANSNQTVYTGSLYGERYNSSAEETNFYGDFSTVTKPGTYYIRCGSLKSSYSFKIANEVYTNLIDDSVRMLYLQRCGVAIQDAAFGHPACHTSRASVYGSNETIDVSGGWHDAGDYGRYVVPAAKTIADLLYAYDANPDLYGDNIGIPESGNGVSDILDEARYGLTWMLKMQASSGGVYHKVTCQNFPGYIMPQDETERLFVTPVSTTATADFCATMAMAYEFYYDIDRNFSETCLAAAKKAWSFLESNPNFIFKNPSDILTGEYGDVSDTDERYWAAAQMYRATRESKYLNAFNNLSLKKGLDWTTVGDYGNIAFLTMDNPDTSSALYIKIKNSILSQADSIASSTSSNPYGVAVSKFYWGSNMTVANSGVILGLANKISSNDTYLIAAESNLNYLLGRNPLATCFVTGHGTVSPKNPHHRPSIAKQQTMKGMLVGGVNSSLEDSAAKAYLANAPSAKCYIDHAESYSTNEVTTYWNSPLTYLLSLTSDNDNSADPSMKGDVDLNGSVDAIDFILLKQHLLDATTLTAEQSKNADINEDGYINSLDFVELKKLLLA